MATTTLMTWNMQGTADYTFNHVVYALQSINGNVVFCMQEAGDVFTQALRINKGRRVTVACLPGPGYDVGRGGVACTYIDYKGGSGKQRTAYLVSYQWDQNGHRVNLAILSSEMPNQMGIVAGPSAKADSRYRPLLVAHFSSLGWVGCIHALSPSGGDRNELLAAAKSLSDQENIYVLGDFNREFDAPGFVSSTEWKVFPPCSYTFPSSRKRLDGLVVLHRNGPLPSTKGQVLSIAASDHYQVKYRMLV